jgi:hypothetical protein
MNKPASVMNGTREAIALNPDSQTMLSKTELKQNVNARVADGSKDDIAWKEG